MGIRLKKLPLSKQLGLSPNTLRKYLLAPGAPLSDEEGTYDLESARHFCSQQAAKARSGNTVVRSSPIEKLRSEKIKMEIAHSRWEFEKIRGEYVHRSEIAGTIWALMAEEMAILRKYFEFELPFKYQGKSPIECQQMNIKALDEAIKRFREGSLPIAGPEAKESA